MAEISATRQQLGGTYWQIIADRALVDERDVPVRNIVILLGSRRNVPELLRVLLEKEHPDPDKTNNSDYRYQTKEIYAILLGSWHNVSELLRVLLEKEHPDPDKKNNFDYRITGTKQKEIYGILFSSRRNVRKLLRVLLEKEHPDPDKRTILIPKQKKNLC